jgi:hypothetical protein
MNIKIYKKICQILRIIIVKDDEGYVEKYIIETRESKKGSWKNAFESRALKKVLVKKHLLMHFAIRHLGYGAEFLQRRKKRSIY